MVDKPVVGHDCEAQRERPEPRCNQDEPVHELGHAAFRRSYVEDEERQRNREDAVANPFCPVGSISPTGFSSFLVRRTIAPHEILPTIAFSSGGRVRTLQSLRIVIASPATSSGLMLTNISQTGTAD